MNKPALKLWGQSPELRFFCRLKTPVRPELVEGLGMVRQAHHERVSGAGSPRTGRSNGLTTNGWLDRLTTIGSVERTHCERMVRQAHHERVSGAGSPRTDQWGQAHHERVGGTGSLRTDGSTGSPRTDQRGGLTTNGSVGQAHRNGVGGSGLQQVNARRLGGLGIKSPEWNGLPMSGQGQVQIFTKICTTLFITCDRLLQRVF